MLGMGRIEAASLAHERSVFPTNPAPARGRFNICPFDRELEFPAGTRVGFAKATARIRALAGAGGTGWCFRGWVSN